MDTDLRIAAIAARQHSVFTRAQATDAGATRAMVRSRLATGRWGEIHRNVYRLAGSDPSWEQHLFAAWLGGGEGAVLSHAAAASIWEVPGTAHHLELSVPEARQPRLRGVVVHRVSQLRSVDRVERSGLLVTTPTRTVIDLCGSDPALAERALDHCLSRRLTTADYLDRQLDSMGRQGRRECTPLDELLRARPTRHRPPESEFERRLLALLARLPGPPPIPQYEIRLPDGRRRRLDAAWPHARLGIEAMSYLYHSSLTHWSADQSRDVELIAAGWRILPVTWVDLSERPDWLLGLVTRARSTEVRDETAV